MNVKRMEKLAVFFDTLPAESFYMGSWFHDESGDELICKTDALNTCGTTCCIAGWAVFVAGKCYDDWGHVTDRKGNPLILKGTNDKVYPQHYAKRYLGLTPVQTSGLFYISGWPRKFKRANINFCTDTKNAAERIRYMIATGE